MQHDLFASIEIDPTPAMLQGKSTVWQCMECGSLVCHDGKAAPAGVCPSCSKRRWSECERALWGRHYSGPFYARAAVAIGEHLARTIEREFPTISRDRLSSITGNAIYAAEHILEVFDHE